MEGKEFGLSLVWDGKRRGGEGCMMDEGGNLRAG